MILYGKHKQLITLIGVILWWHFVSYLNVTAFLLPLLGSEFSTVAIHIYTNHRGTVSCYNIEQTFS